MVVQCPQTVLHSLTPSERQYRTALAAPPGVPSESVRILVPAGSTSVRSGWKSNFFLEHNVGGLIDLTKHPATQEITEN